jgi:hypothetical protein
MVTLWVGSLWTIGYVVAPTLFATLSDKVLAGTTAGRLFQIEAWLSVGFAIALLMILKLEKDKTGATDRSSLRLLLYMLACSLIGYFALHPIMAALREASGPGGVMTSSTRTQFGILHGVSSAIYVVQSLLGVALVFKTK